MAALSERRWDERRVAAATPASAEPAATLLRWPAPQTESLGMLDVRPFWQQLRVQLHGDGISVAALDGLCPTRNDDIGCAGVQAFATRAVRSGPLAA